MNSTKTPARKAANTMTQPTRPASVPIKPVVMGDGTLIGQRLRVWLAAAAGRSACSSVTTASRATLQPLVERHRCDDATVNTDEWSAYSHLPETGRCHKTVCHTAGQCQWARDDDGDGKREVHTNTCEGIWRGVRNFLRPFRGVSKWFLAQYSAIFEWAHNLKRVTAEFLRAMMVPYTSEPT
jgi:transposase